MADEIKDESVRGSIVEGALQYSDNVSVSEGILKKLLEMNDSNLFDFFVYRISLELNCFVVDRSFPRLHCNNYKPTTAEEWSKMFEDELLPPDDCCIVVYNFRYKHTDDDGRDVTRHKTLLIFWCPKEASPAHISLYGIGKDVLQNKAKRLVHNLVEIVCTEQRQLRLENITDMCQNFDQ